MKLDELLKDDDRWEVDSGELRALLDRRDESPFLLIDCREADEHAAWRIGGEVLMSLSNFPSEVATHLEEESLPIVVYCLHGMRSLQAAKYLRDHGHEKTYSLRGGIDAWESAP